jgi:hypothetical protein
MAFDLRDLLAERGGIEAKREPMGWDHVFGTDGSVAGRRRSTSDFIALVASPLFW